MEITIERCTFNGPDIYRFEGHAPDEKYCAAISLYKELIEDIVKYYKVKYLIKSNELKEKPYYEIKIFDTTLEMQLVLGRLIPTLKSIIYSMNEDYPNSCEHNIKEFSSFRE